MSAGGVARAVRYASRGLRCAWREQPNLRIEAALGVVAVAAAVGLRAPLAPILLACGLVLSAELLNSALETIIDRLYPHADPAAGRAKDLGAAAVLAASLAALLVGLVVLGPPAWAAIAAGAAS